jgi:hypothetical protein
MLFKKRYLTEMDDTINELFHAVSGDSKGVDASQAFQLSQQKELSEPQAGSLLKFATGNHIEPSQLTNTAANMASGVGKEMDGNEALDVYNRGEAGQLKNHESHALQNYFENRHNSENFKVDSLMQGLGKNPSGNDLDKYLSNPDGNSDFAERILSKNIGSVKSPMDLASIYPSIDNPNMTDEAKQMAENIRMEKFETNDPLKIAHKLARESGDFPYSSIEEYRERYDPSLQLLAQAQNEYVQSESNLTQEEWLRENYPKEMKDIDKMMSESRQVNDWKDKVNEVNAALRANSLIKE